MRKFFNAVMVGLFLFCNTSTVSLAHEGMWLPTLLANIHDDMAAEGLKLTSEQIYAVNQSSMKDAIVHFGGGCTAEVISDQGLILTNHHCGYGTIQRQSTTENNYLEDGFWAMNKPAELRNKGLTATFMVRMEDVTEKVLTLVNEGMTEQERQEAIAKISSELEKAAIEGTHYTAEVRPFYYGNAFYMIVSETFKDVRLVGAPPSSIGKFGADTDNWVWPRHNADFSLFRIYTAPDGTPAEAADDNVPMKPKHVLPVAMEGPQEGEFAMIYGFPGRTENYLPAVAVKHVMEKQHPMRIQMREASLGVIDAAMRTSDETKLQYASRQSGISNAYKKWIGALKGLTEQRALERKYARENKFKKSLSKEGTEARYGNVLELLEKDYSDWEPYVTGRDLFIEFVYYGPQLFRFTNRFHGVVENYEELKEEGKLDDEIAKLKKANDGHFKNYDVDIDRDVFKAQLPWYEKYMPAELAPEELATLRTKFKGDHAAYVNDIYASSVFTDKEAMDKLLSNFNKGSAKKMKKDPAMRAMDSFYSAYFDKTKAQHDAIRDRVDQHMRIWMQAQMEVLQDKDYWPDANSTMRLSYGKVEGSSPHDGEVYLPFTTLEGVKQKYIPGNYEFDVPSKLLELHEKKDYGQYGEDGVLNVCFTSSLHTTGGNSGSPIVNGRGELIGLNFDRSWESTMSDIMFDPDRCRNIAVDIRYVLFIIDKFAGAKHLVDEMDLVFTKSFDEAELEPTP